VEGSHCGLGVHPAVLFAIADRLSQAEGEWQPFHRCGWRSLVYPDPARTGGDGHWAEEPTLVSESMVATGLAPAVGLAA
jgi:hypothetical protein